MYGNQRSSFFAQTCPVLCCNVLPPVEALSRFRYARVYNYRKAVPGVLPILPNIHYGMIFAGILVHIIFQKINIHRQLFYQ